MAVEAAARPLWRMKRIKGTGAKGKGFELRGQGNNASLGHRRRLRHTTRLGLEASAGRGWCGSEWLVVDRRSKCKATREQKAACRGVY